MDMTALTVGTGAWVELPTEARVRDALGYTVCHATGLLFHEHYQKVFGFLSALHWE